MTAAESAARPRPLDFVWRAIQADVPFYLLVAAFIASGLVLHRAIGYPSEISLSVSWNLMAVRSIIYAAPALVAALAWSVLRHGRTLRDGGTWIDTISTFLDPRHTLAFLLVMFVLPTFMATFTALKVAIPEVHPFAFDMQFVQLDRMLHFGEHPWVLLHVFLGSPPVTAFVDLLYALWFPVLWVTVIWQAWHGTHFSDARAQFLLAMAACWIVIGIGFATLMSSAGPVYYGFVVDGANPFAELMDYLHEVDATSSLTAVWAQDLLWRSYIDPEFTHVAEGISAMPSVHVAMVVLMTLLGFRVNRVVGWAYAAFAVAIMIGSVHLAWHYAIDGYVAAVLTLGIWWASGRVTEAWELRSRRSGGEA